MVGVETPSCHGSGPPPLNERPPDVASDDLSVRVDPRPALRLLRDVLDSPSGPSLATHVLAMIADQNVFEVVRNAAGDGFLLVPSMELVRLARQAGVIAE